ncbi:hypothetical protein BVC80_9101g96 [Macleaya cordata]|uniref:Uncharacterized protein n=1 Tax=Macleaya cordata TaxID=56857 RepID=A0A200QGM5_MACCD|nr:hypothetical protein BVC80_9101g96 [Macleaya cordata]
MEANRKRRGFIKGRLVMSLYRTSKPASTVQFSTKVKPTTSSSATSSGYLVADKEFVVPQSSKKVSFLKSDVIRDSYGVVDAGDENVDMKAATYISYVQERFKLERVDSERRKYQDVHK